MAEAVEPEDSIAGSADFKQWLCWTTAHTSYMRCLVKLADRVDSAGSNEESDSDGAFEDIEIDSEEEQPKLIVDID